MEVVLTTETPEGVRVVLSALVFAKVLEHHPDVADLDLIDRAIRIPDVRRPDPWPTRERFFHRRGRLRVLVVVEYEEIPAVVVTAFAAPFPQQMP